MLFVTIITNKKQNPGSGSFSNPDVASKWIDSVWCFDRTFLKNSQFFLSKTNRTTCRGILNYMFTCCSLNIMFWEKIYSIICFHYLERCSIFLENLLNNPDTTTLWWFDQIFWMESKTAIMQNISSWSEECWECTGDSENRRNIESDGGIAGMFFNDVYVWYHTHPYSTAVFRVA